MIDYRQLENRRECFLRWWAWSVKFKEVDPDLWLANEMANHYNLDTEQRLWISWLYGNTYHFATTWVIFSHFPKYHEVEFERLKEWNDANYKRLRYQTDTRWNKGFLPQMFQSYQSWVGEKQQFDTIFDYAVNQGPSNVEHFQQLWELATKKQLKFGRQCSWMYLQFLAGHAGVPIEPPGLALNDFSGSRSHRNGLCRALAKDEWIDQDLTKEQYAWLETEAAGLLKEAKERWSDIADGFEYFSMETICCNFKKIFRDYKGKYLGSCIDTQSEEIMTVENDGWNIDFDIMWKIREKVLDPRLNKKCKVQKERFGEFIHTGKLRNIEWMFPDEDTKIGLERFL